MLEKLRSKIWWFYHTKIKKDLVRNEILGCYEWRKTT